VSSLRVNPDPPRSSIRFPSVGYDSSKVSLPMRLNCFMLAPDNRSQRPTSGNPQSPRYIPGGMRFTDSYSSLISHQG